MCVTQNLPTQWVLLYQKSKWDLEWASSCACLAAPFSFFSFAYGTAKSGFRSWSAGEFLWNPGNFLKYLRWVSITYLEVIYFTLYLMAILQVCFLGRNGEKSLLMSHLHKIGWVNALPCAGISSKWSRLDGRVWRLQLWSKEWIFQFV